MKLTIYFYGQNLFSFSSTTAREIENNFASLFHISKYNVSAKFVLREIVGTFSHQQKYEKQNVFGLDVACSSRTVQKKIV